MALEAAASTERVDLAMTIAPFGIDKTGVELFDRERAARRVWSLTDGDGGVAPASTVGAAGRTASATRPVGAPSEPQSAPAAVRAGGGDTAAIGRGGDAAARASHATPGRAARVVAPSRPMISVIVPTHDRPDTLRVALETILAQTYRDFEIVVVNDHGTDVQHVIEELEARDGGGRISYVRHAVNRGLAAARNSGLGVARGRFVAYLDDDDRFYPEHLETLVEFLQHGHPVVYSDALRVLQQKRDDRYVTVARDLPYSNDFDRARLLVNNQFPVLCLMHERSCVDAVGGFDETMTSHEDWELWLRMSARFPFHHVASITAEFTHRLDGSSMTSSLQPDFLRTAEIIYERTAADVGGRDDVRQARERFLANLRARVAAESPPQATPSPRSSAPTSAPATPAFDCSIVIPRVQSRRADRAVPGRPRRGHVRRHVRGDHRRQRVHRRHRHASRRARRRRAGDPQHDQSRLRRGLQPRGARGARAATSSSSTTTPCRSRAGSRRSSPSSTPIRRSPSSVASCCSPTTRSSTPA